MRPARQPFLCTPVQSRQPDQAPSASESPAPLPSGLRPEPSWEERRIRPSSVCASGVTFLRRPPDRGEPPSGSRGGRVPAHCQPTRKLDWVGKHGRQKMEAVGQEHECECGPLGWGRQEGGRQPLPGGSSDPCSWAARRDPRPGPHSYLPCSQFPIRFMSPKRAEKRLQGRRQAAICMCSWHLATQRGGSRGRTPELEDGR